MVYTICTENIRTFCYEQMMSSDGRKIECDAVRFKTAG